LADDFDTHITDYLEVTSEIPFIKRVEELLSSLPSDAENIYICLIEGTPRFSKLTNLPYKTKEINIY
jgi:hypothetical protein